MDLTQIDIDGSTVRSLVGMEQIDTDGTTVRVLQELWQNDESGVPQQIFGAGGSGGGVSVAPTYVYGYASSSHSLKVNTSVATARPAGATYLWTLTDPDWTAISPTSASTAFRSGNLEAGGNSTTGFECAITIGASTYHVYGTAYAENLGS